MKRFGLFSSALGMLILMLAGCEDQHSTPGLTDPLAAGVNASIVSGADAGAVYTLSNSSNGNEVISYARDARGGLTPAGNFATGGSGTGSGLGSQGSLILQDRLLFAVNAGSDEISVFDRTPGGLRWVSKISSGGTQPTSLTVHGDLLYVLNAGGGGDISGFRGALTGHLSTLPGSMRPLSGGAVQPAEIEFSPDGRILAVTEKATNRIDTYRVGPDGIAAGPEVQSSTGDTPFGFAFTGRGDLVVSDAAVSALSSYSVNRTGVIGLITGPVTDGQAAACWVTVTQNDRFAYTTNAHSNNISGFRIGHDGALSLFSDGGVTATTGASPTDMALSRDSQYLYVLNSGSESISVYRVNEGTGSLTSLGTVSGLPAGGSGLAAE